MARLSKGRPPSGRKSAPIQVSVRGPLARDPSFVMKSTTVAQRLAKTRRGGRDPEDPLAGPLLR